MFGVRRHLLKDIATAAATTKTSSLLTVVKSLFHAHKRMLTMSGEQRPVLSEQAYKDFNENGAVCLHGIFDEHWLNACERGVLKNLKSPSKYCDWLVDADGKGLFFNDYYNCHLITEYKDYVVNSPAAWIARQAMDSKKVALFHEHVFYKEVGSMMETPWHHDQAYYPLNGTKNCSIWMPTTHIPKQASLKFVKGSHKWDKWFVPRVFKNNHNYEVAQQEGLRDQDNICDIESIQEKFRPENILQWELEDLDGDVRGKLCDLNASHLWKTTSRKFISVNDGQKPGDCILFHMRTIHGTEASLSDKKRIVISTRWLGDDITYTKRPWKTSPPEELLPSNIKLGDTLVENKSLIFPLMR